MARFIEQQPDSTGNEIYTGGDEIGGTSLVRADIAAIVPTARATFITVNNPTAVTPVTTAVAKISASDSLESSRKGWDCDF